MNKQEMRSAMRISPLPPMPTINTSKNTVISEPPLISTTDTTGFRLKKIIPKRVFFYWGGSNLSWMRYMTLYSFKKLNPDWDVTLYLSDKKENDIDCESTKMLDYSVYEGRDYIKNLRDIKIKIEKAEFPKEIANKLSGISPIHESDLFRLYQLFIGGGFYCDMDILFFKPMDDLYDQITGGGYDTIIHEYKSNQINNDWWVTIGFLGSSINNDYFRTLFECGLNKFEKENIEYQAMGVALIYHTLNITPHVSIFNIASKRFPELNFYNLSTTLFYMYDWTSVDYCFSTSIGSNSFNKDSIGYHWYGGANAAQKYNNILTEENYLKYNNMFSRIADEIINDKKIEISIVMAYYNRKKLLYNTLKSIAKSSYKDFELIIVDDGSSSEHRIEGYINEFPFIRIIRIEKEDKKHINPCIPFNIGIRAAVGSIIILQNPECLHVHDVLSYVKKNINDSNYISMSTYSLNDESTKSLLKHIENNTQLDFLKTQQQKSHSGDPLTCGWYNHSIYRPVNYHFCSAITKVNMDKLNGFDERYAMGIGYDDSDFIQRIKRLKLNMIIADNVSVIHQYHPSYFYNLPDQGNLCEKNRLIFCNSVMLENNIKAN